MQSGARAAHALLEATGRMHTRTEKLRRSRSKALAKRNRSVQSV